LTAESTDTELLNAWRDGDQGAGSRLVARHFQSVYRFFRRKIDEPELAKDLTQKTFLTCMEARDKLRDDLRFKAFVLGIARNVMLRQLRAFGKASERAGGPIDPTTSVASPSQVVAMREEQKLLLRALRALPVEFQMTVELHYWEQLTTKEIAEVLEVPAGTVKWRLSRARELLKEKIQELATSDALRESTIGDLERWASSLRQVLDEEAE
jgi:RNA polymerase sigma-70 factor (ECF subfamily)